MSLTTIILVFPIFMVLYKGIGLLLDARRRTVPFGQKRSDSVYQAIRNISGSAGSSTINQLILKKGGFRQRLEEML